MADEIDLTETDDVLGAAIGDSLDELESDVESVLVASSSG